MLHASCITQEVCLPMTSALAASPAIEAVGLRKVYGRDKVAVDHLTLTVPRGEVFGYLGPNGAGKTTSVKMLLGLVTPTAGAARLLGRPLGDVEAKRRIGFLPEQFRFHEWLKAGEFLDFHGQLYGMPSAERRRRIPQVLHLVGLEERTNDRLRTFSKGMLQRIGIGQALIADPKLVILDEPTAALGVAQTAQVLELVRRLADNGLGVVLISHNMNDVFAVSDRIAALYLGRMAAQVKTTDVTHSQVVELITAGRSGNLGLPPERPADLNGEAVVDITPGGDQ